MRAVVRQLATVVVPPRCAACGSPCSGTAALCDRCEDGLGVAGPLIGPGPPEVNLAIAASRFDGVARRVVHGLKYGSKLELAEVCARAMLLACPDDVIAGEVVPVPAAPWRWRWRGFDPAEEIALAIARLAGLPYRPCLKRRRGPTQVGRRRADRLANPPVVWAGGEVPRRALLVDDVHTTGATLSACAGVLRAGGCEDVVALALARAA